MCSSSTGLHHFAVFWQSLKTLSVDNRPISVPTTSEIFNYNTLNKLTFYLLIYLLSGCDINAISIVRCSF